MMPKEKKRERGIEIYKHPKTGKILTIVIRSDFRGKKYNFLTPPDFPLQLGINFYAKGEKIQPHVHVNKTRKIRYVQECIVIKKGRLILYIFDSSRKAVAKTILSRGDIVFLASAGHAFRILRDTDIIEIKQGPFFGAGDKTLFRYDKL